MTSILYPRLLEQTAREMHEQYRTLPIEELVGLHAFSHPSAVFTATGGARVPPSHLKELRKTVVGVAEEAGFPGGGRRRNHSDFDQEIARLLHERCGLVAAEAALRPVWAFLALVVLPDVSYWRYSRPPEDRILGTDITRHVWGRLWWRAHLLVEPGSSDPYRLLPTFGEAEFDQILARRALGASRSLVHAVAETWPTIDKGTVPDRLLLRDLLKRLLRAGAVVEFDALDREELHTQVRAEAYAALRALDREVTS